RREVRVAAQDVAGRLQPVLDEGALEPRDDRTLDADVRVAPMALRSSVARPFRAHARPARESDLAVDDEHAAMIALVVAAEAKDAEERQGPQRPERGDLAPRQCHRLAIRRRHREGPEAIQQDVATDPGPTTLRQRFRDLKTDRALFVEILRV